MTGNRPVLTRRVLLVTAGSALAYGCAAPSPPSPPPPPPNPPPQNILDDIAAILAGLTTALPGLAFLPAALLAQIEGWVATAQQLVAQISSAASTGDVGSLIQGFISVVSQIISAITGVGNLPDWLNKMIGAIQFLLPIIASFLGAGAARRAASPGAEAGARAASPGAEAGARATLLALRVPPGARLHRR